MTDNRSLNKEDLKEITQLLEGIGYALVNDFELAEGENELGFDITGNEVIQPMSDRNLTEDDLPQIEKFVNGCGYSIVSSSNSHDHHEKLTENMMNDLIHKRGYTEMWLDKHNHFMAFIRTIGAVVSMSLSIIVLYKVW